MQELLEGDMTPDNSVRLMVRKQLLNKKINDWPEQEQSNAFSIFSKPSVQGHTDTW